DYYRCSYTTRSTFLF
nr:immunoglobulin light chain junction region [Macaca mulatta]